MMVSISDISDQRKPFNPSVTFHHGRNGIADGTLADNSLAGNASDSEWEYEYSMAETETFYVTLDLPVAKSNSDLVKDPPGGRLTKRKDKWLNSTHAPFIDDRRKQKDDNLGVDDGVAKDVLSYNDVPSGKTTAHGAGSKNATRQRKDSWIRDDEDADDEFEDEIPVSKGDRTNGSKSVAQISQRGQRATLEREASKATKSPSSAIQGIQHDIQILDLHSKSPIVIYRDQQFQCNWAENIGSELLFIKHSDTYGRSETNLPIVRELPGEVDLLAVSGVRLVGRPVHLRPKEKAVESLSKERIQVEAEILPLQTQTSKAELPFPDGANRIPVGIGAKEDRKAQARFLERLAAIKLKRGEYDEVTVNAIPRKEGRPRKRRADQRRREKRILRSNDESEKRKALARVRIAEYDAADAAEENEKCRNPLATQGETIDENSDEDEDEDEDESLTDNDAATNPHDEESAVENGGSGMDELGNERHMYMVEDEDYDMDEEEEDDPASSASNQIRVGPFNPEDIDVDMDADV